MPPLSERVLAELWAGQRFDRSALVDLRGCPLSVVFRGWANRGPGPDFQQAILADPDGHLLRGDVELHVDAADWWAHGHHRDPAYNGVILHVVAMTERAGPLQPAPLASGAFAPTVAIGLPESAWPEALGSVPDGCREAATARAGSELLDLLDRAGDQRLQAKADRYEAELAARDPGEVLYTGLLEALGYTANVAPFRRLGQRVPLAVLEGYCAGKPEDLARRIVEAMLLHAGGFLPVEQPTGGEAGAYLRDLAAAAGHRLAGLPNAPLGWTRRGVRPESAPPRRIAGIAWLIARTRETGLLPTLLTALRDDPEEGAVEQLESLLTAPARGFWATHADLDHPVPPGALIGVERARILIVDSVLPFALALASTIGDDQLATRAGAVFAAVPRLAENAITRRLLPQIDAAGQLRRSLTARRQQGLIHLWRTSCEQRLCETCPIAHPTGT